MPLRLDQLVDRPILQHEADDEHEHAQRPEYCDRRYLAIMPIPHPQPSQ